MPFLSTTIDSIIEHLRSDQPGLGHLVGQSQEWGLAFPASPTSICEIGMAGGQGFGATGQRSGRDGQEPGHVQAESPYLSGLSVWLKVKRLGHLKQCIMVAGP